MKEIKLKSETFRRSTRFTHRFDEGMQDDPFWNKPTFNMQAPVRPDERRSPGFDVQQKGETDYYGPLSGVVTPSGRKTSIDGPRPDTAELIAVRIPAGTKCRKGA